MRFAGNPRFASWKSWRQSGNLYAANFCYHLIPDKLDPFDKQTFTKNPMEFWTVSTNVQTGEPNYHLLKDCSYTDLEWVRASASIPFLHIQLRSVGIFILMAEFQIRFRLISLKSITIKILLLLHNQRVIVKKEINFGQSKK